MFSQREAYYSNDTGELNEKGHQRAGGAAWGQTQGTHIAGTGVWLQDAEEWALLFLFRRTWITAETIAIADLVLWFRRGIVDSRH